MGLIAAMAGAFATLHLAPGAPQGHLEALAAVIVVMAVVSAFSPSAGRQPGWYKIVIPIVGVAGVWASWMMT